MKSKQLFYSNFVLIEQYFNDVLHLQFCNLNGHSIFILFLHKLAYYVVLKHENNNSTMKSKQTF